MSQETTIILACDNKQPLSQTDRINILQQLAIYSLEYLFIYHGAQYRVWQDDHLLVRQNPIVHTLESIILNTAPSLCYSLYANSTIIDGIYKEMLNRNILPAFDQFVLTIGQHSYNNLLQNVNIHCTFSVSLRLEGVPTDIDLYERQSKQLMHAHQLATIFTDASMLTPSLYLYNA